MNKLKSLIQLESYDALKNEIIRIIERENNKPINVMSMSKDEVYREASKRFGRSQILSILEEIEEEALK